METDSKKNQSTQICRRVFKSESNNAANRYADQWHRGFKNDEEQRWLQWALTLQSERNRDSERVQTQRQDESNDAREHTSAFHGTWQLVQANPIRNSVACHVKL